MRKIASSIRFASIASKNLIIRISINYLKPTMNQVNFRLKEDEKNLLKIIAGLQGIPISQLAKQIVLKEIEPKRVDIAFRMLKEGRCGRKRAWQLSGLSYHEFMNEWSLRNAEEFISDDVYEKSLDDALSLDLKLFRKKS